MKYVIKIGNGFYAGDDESVKSDINNELIVKYDNIVDCNNDVNIIVECWEIDKSDIEIVELT